MADTKTITLVTLAGVAVVLGVVLTVVMATNTVSVLRELRHVASALNATEQRLAVVEGNLAEVQALMENTQEPLVNLKTTEEVSHDKDHRLLERFDAADEKLQVTLDAVREIKEDIGPWKEELGLAAILVEMLNKSLVEMCNTTEQRLQNLQKALSKQRGELGESYGDSKRLLESITTSIQNVQKTLTIGLEDLDRRQNVSQTRLDAVETATIRTEDILLSFTHNATANAEKLQTEVLEEIRDLHAILSDGQSRLSGEFNATLIQLQLLHFAVRNGTEVLENHVDLGKMWNQTYNQHQCKTAESLEIATTALGEMRNVLESQGNSSDGLLLQIKDLLLQLRNNSENHSKVVENDLRSLNASLVYFKMASEKNHAETLQQLHEAKLTIVATVEEGINKTSGSLDAVLDKFPDEPSRADIRPVRSCEELKQQGFNESGIYNLSLQDGFPVFKVFCDMKTDNKAWVVIQRRTNGSIDFFRNWADYKEGFGSLSGEFWLGNDKLHRLTASGLTKARFQLEDWSGLTRYADYSSFNVTSESDEYKLHISGYSGTAGDGMAFHNGYAFSTKDQGRNNRCATSYTGAWWYGNCHHVNLNGHYYTSNPSPGSKGVNWLQWLGYTYSLKGAEIKLR